MKKFVNSNNLLSEAKSLIPALSQTFSKAPYSYVEGVYPTYLESGKGSHVFDVDNNEFIDYVLALGPITLGYNYPKVNKAITSQLKKGISFSIPHSLEVEVSKKLNSIIPNADMVRFAKTGSDACTAAVRCARAFTKREKIAYCGTGGVWHDWFTIITSRNEGIPKFLKKMIKKFNFNDIESLKIIAEEWKDDLAAIYIEPIMLEYPEKSFLKNVKKIAKNIGAVLIFDEVVTGFRYSLGGAQEFLNIKADITALGKGMANGMPLAAITGKQEIMEKFNDIFYSTTYGGETLSLAACSAVIDEFQEKPVINHITKLSSYFYHKFNELTNELDMNVKMEGTDVRSVINYRDTKGNISLLHKSCFYQEMINQGILFGPGAVLLSYSHSKNDIDVTLDSCRNALLKIKKYEQKHDLNKLLKGNKIKPVMTF
jgi:glutamate-1-semialdehyde 2,1-aminomutase